jgi:hypothetical protein
MYNVISLLNYDDPNMNIILRWSGDFPGIFINYTLNTTAMSKLDEIEMARQ